MGLNYNYADLTVYITLKGGGLDHTYNIRPVTNASFVAWSPPGALNTQSPVVVTQRQLGNGDNTIITGAQLAKLEQALGIQVTYVAYVPNSNSTNYKILKGAAGDTGFGVAPNLWAIIALPNPVPPAWEIILNCPASNLEIIQVYIW